MAERQKQKVYILILNWNNAKETIECLDAVFKTDYPDYQVVLLDNGSTDGSEEKIRQWVSGKGFQIIRYGRREATEGGRPEEVSLKTCLVFIQNGENLGYAGGNNAGLEFALARGDMRYAWLLNNDTLPEAGALKALVACCTEKGVGMAGPKLLYAGRPGVLQTAGGCKISPLTGNASVVAGGRSDDGKWDTPFELDSVCGASLLVKREVLEAVGLLEAKYFLYWEDADWSMRARRAGFKLLFCPAGRVLHREGATSGAMSETSDYYWVRNGLYFTKKFYPWLLPLVPFAYLAKHTIVRMLRHKPLNLKAYFSGLLDFLLGRSGRKR
ncbi:MAG: glycosyltransferase family 2 protein [Nitrospiraceae bacterium]|nr:glycosyltransferase family 2 protein [Nitrospiraceae bacterium]